MEAEASVDEGAPSGLAEVRERVESELHAAAEGLAWGPGALVRFRKWLGWALYRAALAVNPEVGEPD